MRPTKQLVHRREFFCMTCEPQKGLHLADIAELKAHLTSVHKFNGRITGSKKMVSCMDMERGQYQNNFDWTLPGGVKISEVSTGTRE